MTKWQPIETAPRDGTRILSFSPESNNVFEFNQQDGIQVCYWDDSVNIYHSEKLFKCAWVICYATNSGEEYLPDPVFCRPTHWMPNPKPPETEE